MRLRYLLPKNIRYWLVRPKTLTLNYHDADTLILHSVMQILTDFYEDQIKTKRINWEATARYKDVYNQMEEIYYWWKDYNDIKKSLWDIPDLPEPEYSNYIHEAQMKESKLEDQADEMLIKLMKIRQFLWD